MVQEKIKDTIEVDSKIIEDLKCITVKLPQDIKDKLLNLYEILLDSVTIARFRKCFYSIFYDYSISLSSIKSRLNKDKFQEVLLELSGGNRQILRYSI